MDPQATMDTMHRLMIKREAALWFATGRAIHAWRIRKVFREAGWSVPDEIEVYLDGCADRLLEADLTSPEQVANALLLDRKGRNANFGPHGLAVAEHVFGLKAMDPSRSLESIFDEVATHLNARGKRASRDKDAKSFVEKAYRDWLRRVRMAQKNRQYVV
jgi:hypothetical protein